MIKDARRGCNSDSTARVCGKWMIWVSVMVVLKADSRYLVRGGLGVFIVRKRTDERGT